jgi:biopolymer transport protein ExbD
VRPARQTLPPGSTHPARQEPPPRLAPEVSSDREKRLTEEINTTIQEVERALLSVDRQQLSSDQWETYQTIQSFLTQARKSVAHKDFQQAMNLAQKANVLSHGLSKAVR